MEGSYNPEVVHRPSPSMRGPRGYKPFKNPPQPHMCIQDSIKGTSEKLYINVMSWKQIANSKQCADLIPLYGGMQISHGCTPNCNRPPLIIFAVMVNPEILQINGKNAANPQERDALVNLLCDFVEAMNPGLYLTKKPVILKDRDLAGELKDVWHAVQIHREKEKMRNQEFNSDVTHKIYHIDGPDRDPGTSESIDQVESLVTDSTKSILNDNNSKNINENIDTSLLNRTELEKANTKTSNHIEVIEKPINPSVNSADIQIDNNICNNVEKVDSKENLSVNCENGSKDILEDSQLKLDIMEHSTTKYDKQKYIHLRNQIPIRSNSKKKLIAKQKCENSDKEPVLLNSNTLESNKIENKISSDLKEKDNSSCSINMLNSLTLTDLKTSRNQLLSNQNAQSGNLNFDNKEPDDAKKIERSFQKQNEQSGNLQKCIIEPVKNNFKNVDTPVTNIDDQNKVPLSSQ